ncbi:MAG: polysaccharide deacetylase family protein [Polyangiales bacterium]|nr:polysaccharide deacetylase family protein [Myxococcales bacterium]
MERVACISVDLDEVDCYAAIHGLDAPPGAATHAIYDRAIPRFRSFFDELEVPATFFVIGRDLERPANVDTVRALHAAGHELANHSYEHRYDLTRGDAESMRSDIARGIDAIAAAIGEHPRGFRAPGYTVNDTLFEVLDSLGVDYDSSVFPCPSYYAAKTAAITAIAARGRRSHSIVDDPRVLSAPADPYRVGAPYWRRGEGMLELPIGVTRGVTGRLPFIGTSVVMAGTLGAATLARMAVGRPLVNLELHGMDLADAADDELEFLAPHQPDLRRTAEQKRQALRAAVEELRFHGYRFMTLADAADTMRAVGVH